MNGLTELCTSLVTSSSGPPSFSMYIEMLEGSEDEATSECSIHVVLLPKMLLVHGCSMNI